MVDRPTDAIATDRAMACGAGAKDRLLVQKNNQTNSKQPTTNDASQFQTRFGANYKKTGRKESSLPAMYAIKSCDVFHSHTWVQSLAPMFDIPEPEHDSPLAAEGIPTNISTTILVPYIDTGMFGAITEGSVACACAPCPP